jgi:hypothetical protein
VCEVKGNRRAMVFRLLAESVGQSREAAHMRGPMRSRAASAGFLPCYNGDGIKSLADAVRAAIVAEARTK